MWNAFRIQILRWKKTSRAGTRKAILENHLRVKVAAAPPVKTRGTVPPPVVPAGPRLRNRLRAQKAVIQLLPMTIAAITATDRTEKKVIKKMTKVC